MGGGVSIAIAIADAFAIAFAMATTRFDLHLTAVAVMVVVVSLLAANGIFGLLLPCLQLLVTMVYKLHNGRATACVAVAALTPCRILTPGAVAVRIVVIAIVIGLSTLLVVLTANYTLSL